MNGTRRRSAWRGALLLIPLALSASAGAADVGPPIPAPRGFVTDEAGVIPAEKNRAIAALATELEQKTGASSPSSISSTQPLDGSADGRLRRWKVGKRSGTPALSCSSPCADGRCDHHGLRAGRHRRTEVGRIIDTAIVPSFGRETSAGILGAWAIAQVIAADAMARGTAPSRAACDGPADQWLIPWRSSCS
jgi:hypothetical protein